tara:strand:+ start:1286 stop:1825 length:540 start_codon:yes stop_codon:yes gene_type:complete
MLLKSLDGCLLKIGSFPAFHYNAYGGGGKGTLLQSKNNNTLTLNFSSKTFSIPPLNSQTTNFLSLPLPPGLQIDMSMDKLEGTIDQNSGAILLEFNSKFVLSILGIFHFPPLLVETILTTGKIKGNLHQGTGLVLQKNGITKLVGLAIIPQTGNKVLDIFLDLPNEALAELNCEIKSSN